jgi:hypothetical protein
MPQSIVDDVLARFAPDKLSPVPIVERDQAFNESDIVFARSSPPSARRFIQGGNLGNRWFIWHERGGIALEQHIWGYELNQSADKPVLLGRIEQRPSRHRERPCDEIVDFLNRRGPEPGPLVRVVNEPLKRPQ